jgi:hypothetical protein
MFMKSLVKCVLRVWKKGDSVIDHKKASLYLDANVKQMQLAKYIEQNPEFDPKNCTYAESQRFNEWLKSESK